MSKQTKVVIGAGGVVKNSGVHDASIFEVVTKGEVDNISALVRCRTEDGQTLIFRFEEVRFFNTLFYGPQNVVSDCIVLSGLDARSELSEIKDFELYTFEKIDRINDEIKKGELTLVRFIPSVGAAIDCLCRRIELEIG